MTRIRCTLEELTRGVNLSTGRAHDLTLTPPVRVEIFLHDEFLRTLPNAPFALDANGRTHRGQADGDGLATVVLSSDAERCRLRWSRDAGAERFEFERDIYLDLLEPDSEDGLQRRLHNLGESRLEHLGAAVERFQARVGLDVTGEADASTQSALDTHARRAAEEVDSAPDTSADSDDTKRT